jgi:hypothetical protein
MSERIDARQTTPASAAKHANGVQETLGKRARERNSPLPSADTAGSTLPRPAHPSNRLLAQLNERWRVVDDPLQWRLQKKKGNLRDKNSGWDNRSFCRTKDDLLRCIREHCCSPDQGQLRSIREYNGVDKVALQQVRALPDKHTANTKPRLWRPRHLWSAMLANSNPQELALLSISLGALWEGSGP